jgi:hypothetical protein
LLKAAEEEAQLRQREMKDKLREREATEKMRREQEIDQLVTRQSLDIQNRRDELQQVSQKRMGPVRWVPDQQVAACQSCQEAFTLTKRRVRYATPPHIPPCIPGHFLTFSSGNSCGKTCSITAVRAARSTAPSVRPRHRACDGTKSPNACATPVSSNSKVRTSTTLLPLLHAQFPYPPPLKATSNGRWC